MSGRVWERCRCAGAGRGRKMVLLGSLALLAVWITGCSTNFAKVVPGDNVEVERIDETTKRYSITDATSYHKPQDQTDTCTAACLLMYYGMTGRSVDDTEEDLIAQHRKDWDWFFPGVEGVSEFVRAGLEGTKLVGGDRDALYTWEIEDGLVPGQLDWMKQNGVVVIEGVDVGVTQRMTLDQIAMSVMQGEPVIAVLTEGGQETQRHAYVVVRATIANDNKVTEFGVLDPLEEAYIFQIDREEFGKRIRSSANVSVVTAANENERDWVNRRNFEPGFYGRAPGITKYFYDPPVVSLKISDLTD